jgi:hypothetical protein
MIMTEPRGGKRDGAGRPYGSKTLLYRLRDEAEKAHPNFNIISWLADVIQNNQIPIDSRLRASALYCRHTLPPPDDEQTIIDLPSMTVLVVDQEDDG